jgi:hypothetical protein
MITPAIHSPGDLQDLARWGKHLLKSGAERKCKKRLNEGVFDGLPFANCIGI